MALATRYNDALFASILTHFPAHSKRVLDFGAGTGLFVERVRRHLDPTVEVSALEIDPKLIERIRRRETAVPILSSLEVIPDQSLDYVYSLNVLEHIEDDLSVLQQLRKKLKPGGSLYLYVPAFMCLYSSNDRKVGHFRRYRRKALRDLLLQAGFQPTFGRYRDPVGFFAALVFKWLDRKQTGSISPGSLVFFDRFLFPISRACEPIFGRLLGKNVEWTARVE